MIWLAFWNAKAEAKVTTKQWTEEDEKGNWQPSFLISHKGASREEVTPEKLQESCINDIFRTV